MSRNTFGSSITVTLFGESHGPEIGAVLDGFAPTDLRYVVMNGDKQICWTRNLEDANYVMVSVKGSAKLTALTLSVMFGWKPDKNEEVPHGI